MNKRYFSNKVDLPIKIDFQLLAQIVHRDQVSMQTEDARLAP